MNEELILEAVEDWRKRLYMEHWRIDLHFGKETEEYQAKVEALENSYRGSISFEENLFSLSPREVNEMVCHELLHLGHRTVYPGSIKYLSSMARNEQQMFTDYLYDQIEQYVDSIAYVLSELYMPDCLRELIEDKKDKFYLKKSPSTGKSQKNQVISDTN